MSALRPDARCALDGVRILDLSRVVAGNALTAWLADQGAEVIKIEPPGRGDDLRGWRVKGVSTYWKVYARNKKSVTLNLRDARGRDLLLRLVAGAQVLVENFRPGVLEEMGLAPDRLWQENSRLVVVRVSGWGQDGLFRHKPGFGSLVEGMSGFAAMNGFADRPPVLPPLAMADMIAGLSGAAAVLVALREVEVKAGGGQVIDLPLFDPIFSILGPNAANFRLNGKVEPRVGNRSHTTAPRNVYATKDAGWVALSASTQGMFERLMRSIGRAELIADPRCLANADRVKNVEMLDEAIGGFIGQRSLADNLEHFEREGVTVGPICDIADLMEHPYIKSRGVIVEIPDDEMGSLPMHAVQPRLSGTPGAIRLAAPRLGQHNAEILGALGLDAGELRQLAGDGVL
ncbi:MAG: CoA transferase [Alphaproteobacteria bacterium]|nr:CoA transferase [Alphaproteobacteria bacterium]